VVFSQQSGRDSRNPNHENDFALREFGTTCHGILVVVAILVSALIPGTAISRQRW
jgi:hypothetical protein